jgi:hypothetical protein
MTGEIKYTASVMSLKACRGTGEWELCLEDFLPLQSKGLPITTPLHTLEDAFRHCFKAGAVFREHLEKGAMPTLVQIRSPEGLVALAEVEVMENPRRLRVIWQNELDDLEAHSLTSAIDFNLKKGNNHVYDAYDDAVAKGALISLAFSRLKLESYRYAEPVEGTMALMYKIERELGAHANRAKRLEDALGL